MNIKGFLNKILTDFPEIKTWQEHEETIGELLNEYNVPFVASPNGTQRYPDFRITVNGVDYDLEAKTSKGGVPMYNDSIPHQDGIYLFTNMKNFETTIYNGSDVISKEKSDEYRKLKEILLGMCKENEKTIPIEDDLGNVGCRFRLFIEHKKFNLFKNPKRKDIEDRIVKELTNEMV